MSKSDNTKYLVARKKMKESHFLSKWEMADLKYQESVLHAKAKRKNKKIARIYVHKFSDGEVIITSSYESKPKPKKKKRSIKDKKLNKLYKDDLEFANRMHIAEGKEFLVRPIDN